MWAIKEWTVMCFLGVAAIWDLIKREIPIWYLALGTLAAVVCQVRCGKEEIIVLLFGGLTGILFLIISKYSQQELGYGDSWMILILGIMLGVWKLLVVLGIAFLSAAAIAGVGIASRRLTRRSKLPFYPFLFIGYLGVCGW